MRGLRVSSTKQCLVCTLNVKPKSGIGFRSLQENIDTTTSGGKLVFHVFGALVEFERDLIRERTQAGLVAARAWGRRGGRPKVAALNDPKKVAMALRLWEDKTNTIKDICRTLRVSRATLYRYLPKAKKETSS